MATMITTAVQLVAMLFAAFDGFLQGMFPAEIEESRFVSGFVSFASVLAFLFLKILAQSLVPERLRLRLFVLGFLGFAAVFLGSGFLYKAELDNRTFRYPTFKADAPLYLAGS